MRHTIEVHVVHDRAEHGLGVVVLEAVGIDRHDASHFARTKLGDVVQLVFQVIRQRGLNEVASIVGCGVPVDFRAVTKVCDGHGQLVRCVVDQLPEPRPVCQRLAARLRP